MASVTLEEISKIIGDHRIIDDISLQINDSEFFCVIGPSGCGKTTLLRLIAGLEPPTHGTIHFDGEDVTSISAGKRDIAMVFQTYALYPHMRARGNIAFPLTLTKLHKKEVNRRVITTAEDLGHGLVELLEMLPRELSAGGQQRVAVGRAIVRHPRVYLFDEPLSNLDAQIAARTRVEFRKLIQKYRRTVIYVTPSLREAFALGDRIAVMRAGRIEQINTATGLWSRPANLFVADFVHQEGLNSYDARLDQDASVIESGHFRAPLAQSIRTRLRGRDRFIIGLLPSRVQLGAPAEECTVVAQVELVETLLPERKRRVHLTRGSFKCIAEVGLDQDVRRGQWYGIDFDLEQAFLFDAATGQTLY